MKKILSVCLILTAVLISFNSCGRFEFMHDKSEIAKVELIEYSYNCDSQLDYEAANQVVLATISDVDNFVFRLHEIKRSRRYNFRGDMLQKCLAFKVTYASGDYEIIISKNKAVYYSDTKTLDTYAQNGWWDFEPQEFHDLIMSHAPKNGTYTFMHDISKIIAIDFVKVSEDQDGNDLYEVISTVDNIEEFISDQQGLRYIYDTENPDRDRHVIAYGHELFRITYSNGNYELFGENIRQEVCTICNAYWHDIYVCIGTFDSVEYENFKAKYAGN